MMVAGMTAWWFGSVGRREDIDLRSLTLMGHTYTQHTAASESTCFAGRGGEIKRRQE
jgi:hypothetical protein